MPTLTIPTALIERPQWVCYRHESRGGKPTKIPYMPGGHRRASSTEPGTWCSYDTAAADRTTSGIGYVFTADDPFTGIDLDDCLDGTTLAPWAQRVLDDIGPTYTEISPSQTGLKLWVRGTLPPGSKHRRKIEGGEIEVYDRARFFTVTGDRWGDTSEIATVDIAAWHARWFPDATRPGDAPKPTGGGFEGSDEQLIAAIRRSKQAERFDQLWNGDYDDHSAADLALCNILAWWCGPDHDRIDRLFRESGLYRTKWERDDYRERTIQQAIDRCDSFYTPRAMVAAVPHDSEVFARAKRAHPYMMTDLGNAERLVEHFRDRIKYCAQTEQWYLWDGRRWALDREGRINVYAASTVREIYTEARLCKPTDADIAKELSTWGVKSEAAARLAAMIKLAQSMLGVVVRVDDLDADPWLFNCSNGTIDLRTGVLKQPDPDDLITHVSPYGYHPNAIAPQWERFLLWAFQDDIEMIEYVQEILGMGLSGSISEQILPVFYGSGGNGKSVILDSFMDIVGDYAGKAAPDLLMTRHNNEHPTEIADLWGKRLVLSSEPEEGKSLRSGFVKEITGDATCKGRFMRGNFFEFRRTFNILLVTNHKPKVNEGKNSMWRRLRLVPFNAKITDDAKEDGLHFRLVREEAVGILAWFVRGCMRWFAAGGLDAPASVREATAQYRDEEDPLAEFVDDRLTLDPDGFLPAAELRKTYAEWAEAEGILHRLGDRKLAGRIAELDGVKRSAKRVHGVSLRGYSGVALRKWDNVNPDTD